MIEKLVQKMEFVTGLRRAQGPRKNDWQPHEVAIVREHYAKLGLSGVHAMLPGRTKKAINNKALEIKVTQPQFWTQEHDELIRQNYTAHGAEYVSKLTGRSVCSVRYRAARLKVPGDKQRAPRIMHEAKKKNRIEKVKQEKPQFILAERPKRTKAPKIVFTGEEIINEKTKFTKAPPFSDDRYRVTSAPRVIDSSQCRDWARLA
jgi:hypothetical protein